MDTLISRGLVGPFQLDDLNLVAKVESQIVGGLSPMRDRHIDNENIHAIFLDRNLQSKVEQYFGKNLLLWRSNFFVKKESSGEIGWHHDRHFENDDELINFYNLNNHFSILIAVTDIGEGHGEIEFIPGSHLPDSRFARDSRPFHKRELAEHFYQLPSELLEQAETLLLKKGEFALFHSGLLHHSKPFLEGRHRVSMIGRLAKHGTKIPEALAKPETVIPFN